jgi:anthranilate phosphoribosyltransferase
LTPPTVDELGGWGEILTRVLAGRDLDRESSAAVMGAILSGEALPSQIAGFLVALRAKGATAEEMVGFVRAMHDAGEYIDLEGLDAIDTCGTGGSEQRRSAAFNVSTLAAVVVAGAGGRVCKHGNRRASATSGSADLLDELGVAVDLPGPSVARCVRESGLGFAFAPRFHPGMRHAGPVRRELGVRTVFNFIGPLANPARVRRQVVGVCDASMAESVAAVLHANGAERAMVVHGHDGLDELTTTGPSTVIQVEGDHVRRFEVSPIDLGLAPAPAGDLQGGDARANAEIARQVLGGEHGPRRDLVLLNAAAGIVVAGLAADMTSAVGLAEKSIDTGAAAGVLGTLVRVSQEEAAG